ncbi:MAG: sigma 54-interacting transcriptional regulator [Planctomycetes bacterium]|nr:sigma 54-interacting transcriptional regulator [Planctomycetota bacterium]
MSDTILDLLDAITEARVANPQLRPSVLAALRFATGDGLLRAARLVTLRHDGVERAIMAHGEASVSEEEDRRFVAEIREARAPIARGDIAVLPLGKGKRLYGVLILEGGNAEVGTFLADQFLQWCAMAEFVSIEKAELIDENHQLREEIKQQYDEKNIVGVSGSFRRVVENALRVAGSNATVLVHGETGTGKELVARLIHERSNRANGPFIPVNCGALSESLLESELFGHVKGAFTGAIADRKGRFEAANGGTIFLDEIGEVSTGMQVRLLRVLQEMEIERVGDHRAHKLDVRVVAATNRVLEDEVRKGTFRADLYYRLNVVYLHIPPLRNRPEDVPLLVEHFLGRACHRNCKFIETLSRDVIETLSRYPWPGNVRELENCIEKMVVMAPGRELTADLLPMTVMAYDPHQENDRAHGLASFEARLKNWMQSETAACMARAGEDLYKNVRNKWERYLFEAVLDAAKNNKSKAAQVLGITRNTLNQRLGELCDVKREWAVD